MEAAYLFTRQSSNAKTGPMPTVIATRESCPPTCPLYRGGCYALSGPMAMHWKRTTGAGSGTTNLAGLAEHIAALPNGTAWRYATAGDLPGAKGSIDHNKLFTLIRANRGRKGFTYTHKPVIASFGATERKARANRMAVAAANRNGFTVNLSSNHLEEADAYLALKIAPVVTIVPIPTEGSEVWKTRKTPGGATVVQCPAEYSAVQCSSCGNGKPLCSRSDRNYVVGFTVHGTGKAKASAVARGRGLAILQ